MLLFGVWSLSQHPSQVALPSEQPTQVQIMESGGHGSGPCMTNVTSGQPLTSLSLCLLISMMRVITPVS